MSNLLKPRSRVDGFLDYLCLAFDELLGRRPVPEEPRRPEPPRQEPPARPLEGGALAYRPRPQFGRGA